MSRKLGRKGGDDGLMLWVDDQSYFGPDRRVKPRGLRVRERRRFDCASPPPPLPTAMRQLRMHVIEACGAGVANFASRARGVAQLAELQHEPTAADVLSALAAKVERWSGQDVRQMLYADLDGAQAALQYD